MKFSIITPSYNQGQFISQTISSILTQTGDFELEHIIIDGQSTDNSLPIIQETASRETRIKWVSEPDQGQSDAINKGLRKASGEIIGWLNSDDFYEPGSLQKVNDYFKANPQVKWIIGQCKIVNQDSREIRNWITAYKNWQVKRYSYKKLLTENFVSQPAIFWRRELLSEIGYLDLAENYCMDYDLWLRFGQKYQPGLINQYLSNFRYHQGSKSGQVNKKQFQDSLRLAKKYGQQYKTSLLWHRLNYWKIITDYKLLSWLGK